MPPARLFKILPVAALAMVLLIGGWSLYKNRPSADTNVDIKSFLTPRGFGANACPPAAAGFTCKTPIKSKPINAIEGKIKELLSNGFAACLIDNDTNLPISPKNLKIGQSLGYKSMSCKIRSIEQGNPIKFYIEGELDFPGANHGMIFKNSSFESDKIDTKAAENIPIIGKASGETFASYEKGSWNIWVAKGHLYKFSYNIDGQMIFDLDDKTDFSNRFRVLNAQFAYSGIKINAGKSHWFISATGKLDAWVSASKEKGEMGIIKKFDFCPLGCKAKTRVELLIDATKTAVPGDPVYGNIVKESNHEEIYSGTGQGNPKTGEMNWHDDLEVIKYDTRILNYDLGPSEDLRETYNLEQRSDAKVQPFLKYCQVNTKKNESVSIDSQAINLKNPDQKTNQGTSGKIENLTESRSYDDQKIFRDGTGEFTTPEEILKGIYTDESPLMKVTEAMPSQPNHPAIGKFIDPIASAGPQYNLIFTNFINSDAPGRFSAEEKCPQETVVASQDQFKLSPKRIMIFKSFSGSKPNEKLRKEADRVEALVRAEAFKIGVKVISFQTDSWSKMSAALGQTNGDDIIFNFGHGDTIGLSAGEERVLWGRFIMALHEKQVAAYFSWQCYSGNTPLFSDVLIGSISVGAWPEGKNFSNFFGIGYNKYMSTADDLVKMFKQLTSSCQKN